MPKRILLSGILFALFGVIIGAFGAHGLQKFVDNGTVTAKQMQDYETAVRYQMYHAFALIALGIMAGLSGPNRGLVFSFRFFICGIFFFSGSLYLIALKTACGLGELNWIWPFTPIGGLFFMLGWIFFAISVWRGKPKQEQGGRKPEVG
ncbi:MAG TPA: DUF423 domain-containing protein [Bacteroidia bacterium]|jgi:uncharacterized membrane protein YgdD (TMEM256/DUF423 family)|nr:DUF423 domain-containing protein [Bacteroidia bacterium]